MIRRWSKLAKTARSEPGPEPEAIRGVDGAADPPAATFVSWDAAEIARSRESDLLLWVRGQRPGRAAGRRLAWAAAVTDVVALEVAEDRARVDAQVASGLG